MLEGKQTSFVVDTERPVAADPTRRDDSMAGDERREPVPRAEGAGGARGPRPAREGGELAVRDHLSPRHRAQDVLAVAVEAVVELELDVGEVILPAGEEFA